MIQLHSCPVGKRFSFIDTRRWDSGIALAGLMSPKAFFFSLKGVKMGTHQPLPNSTVPLPQGMTLHFNGTLICPKLITTKCSLVDIVWHLLSTQNCSLRLICLQASAGYRCSTHKIKYSRILFEATDCTAFRCDLAAEDSLWESKREMLNLGLPVSGKSKYVFYNLRKSTWNCIHNLV